MELDHFAQLVDERLEAYLDETDIEFCERLDEYREFVRGKMIAIVMCRKILDNVLSDILREK